MKINDKIEYLIFSDLDGTLLNHEDYSYEEAKEMLRVIKKSDIPLIFTTSKTRLETEKLRKTLDITAPFIVENGAAIYFPKDDLKFSIPNSIDKNDYLLIRLGAEYKDIKNFIDTYKTKFHIHSFGNMTIEDVMEYTGLSYDESKMAKKREFSEPFIIRDERRLTELGKLAEMHQMKIIKGGRFYHCIGIGQDKGKAVLKTIELYKKNTDKKVISIALGDNYNDIDMLKEVNIPILIPHHEEKYIETDIPNLIKAKYKGSKGWNETLKQYFIML